MTWGIGRAQTIRAYRCAEWQLSVRGHRPLLGTGSRVVWGSPVSLAGVRAYREWYVGDWGRGSDCEIVGWQGGGADFGV